MAIDTAIALRTLAVRTTGLFTFNLRMITARGPAERLLANPGDVGKDRLVPETVRPRGLETAEDGWEAAEKD